MNDAAERARRLFASAYGALPLAVASAPGRVNLIGEHVDYHGGLVLPMAIAERTAVAVGPAAGRFRAVSEDPRFGAHDVAWPPERGGGWFDYVAGAARTLADERGIQADGVAIAVAGDVPAGAGLASSAAIEVAAIAALAQWWKTGSTVDDIARIAHKSETTFVGVPAGVMDQIASACATEAGALLLDCRSLERTPVPVPVELVIADSGERHENRSGGYVERREEGHRALALLREIEPSLEWLVDIPPARLPALAQALPDPLGKRVRHVVNEHQRTRLAARALEADDPEGFGVLVNASHASLRDLYECSTPRLDAIALAARALPHVMGARLVGAGWGGAVLVVCRKGSGGAVAARLRTDGVADDVRVVLAGQGVRVEP